MELTPEQQRALDTADGVPARVAVHGDSQPAVLLPAEHFDWIRDIAPDIPDAPRAADPRSGKVYAVIPMRVYDRFMPMFEEDPPGPKEREYLLREWGRRAGWDDPEMDVYDELDPRKQQP